MQIREYSLPSGWYPRNSTEVTMKINNFLSEFDRSAPFTRAVIAPHAGWYYCGRIAARAFSLLEPEADTVIILGGHLPPGYPPLFALEDAVRTPFGTMPLDTELRLLLFEQLGGAEDRYRDNTVEVLLPMAHFFFPHANLLWLRLPAEITSFNAGKSIAQAAAKLNRKVNVIASTDLTHYGKNYGFCPRGKGEAALRWVREENDAAFIKAVQDGKPDKVLLNAEKDSSSCSAGAVLGAMGFAEEQSLNKPDVRLLEYATSADMDETPDTADSFVGYAAMAF
jgi:hypothetical protein